MRKSFTPALGLLTWLCLRLGGRSHAPLLREPRLPLHSNNTLVIYCGFIVFIPILFIVFHLVFFMDSTSSQHIAKHALFSFSSVSHNRKRETSSVFLATIFPVPSAFRHSHRSASILLSERSRFPVRMSSCWSGDELSDLRRSVTREQLFGLLEKWFLLLCRMLTCYAVWERISQGVKTPTSLLPLELGLHCGIGFAVFVTSDNRSLGNKPGCNLCLMVSVVIWTESRITSSWAFGHAYGK